MGVDVVRPKLPAPQRLVVSFVNSFEWYFNILFIEVLLVRV